MLELIDLAKQVAYYTGREAARAGTPTTKNGSPLISMTMGRFYNELLIATGLLGEEVKEAEYTVIMKALIAEYENGFASVPLAERLAAEEAEADINNQLVKLIQQHFPGSIIVPL